MNNDKSRLSIFLNLREMIGVVWTLNKGLIFIMLVETIINAASYFPLILFPKYIIDALVAGKDYSYLLLLIGLMIAFSYLINSINITLSNIRSNLSTKMGFTLSNMISAKCMNIDYELYDNQETLNKRYYAYQVVNDNNFVALLQSVCTMASNLVVISGIIYITVRIDYWVLFIALLVIVIQAFITSKDMKKQLAFNQEVYPYMRRNEYLSQLANVITYRKDLITYEGKDFVVSKLDGYNKIIFDFFKRLRNFRLFTGLTGNTISQLYQFAMYVFLGAKALNRVITIGDFSLYLSALNTFVSSTNSLITSVIDMKRRAFFFDKYKEFMDLKSKFDTGRIKLDEIKSDDFEIEFRNVSFKYPKKNEYALKNINIKIRKNSKLAVVGENGAGKTTFALLLMRLYDVTEGEILFNGVNIKDIVYDDYVKIFGSVYQDYKIFGFTVLENVVFKSDASEAERALVTDLFGENDLSDRLHSLKSGLDTSLTKILDQNGEDLSGGESQKLAIIRALYKDAPLLIMDEPTASLDPNAEYKIYKKFSMMTNNKTAIYITHRLASTQFCDEIIVFGQGEIIERGTHEQLLDEHGTYYEMFSKQSEFYVANQHG